MKNPFKKKEELLDPYTVEQCNSCNKTSKRQFKEGDYVFKILEKCTSCGNGQIIISKIFGESIKS
ncbi:MAG: hypothetical protein KGI28_00205 [Thaumarchaeota archaeon]|nr:hypothetical protein [Nitrososphaerota archaeon]